MTSLLRLDWVVAAAILFCSTIFGGVAGATVPGSAYVVPTAVEFLPDRAGATSVVIHGAFILTPHGFPVFVGCGKMYFACAAGHEADCRMQWGAIAAGIGQPMCQGFGAANSVAPGSLRTEGSALVGPDTWDLGTGILPDDYVEKYCPVFALGADCVVAARHDMGVVWPTDFGVYMGDMAAGDLIDRMPPPASCSISRHGARRGGLDLAGVVFALLIWRGALRRAGRRSARA